MNQRLEWQGDALMSRTAGRPLPAGRLSRSHATVFSLAVTAAGFAMLAMAANLPLLLLALAGWLIYVAIYTPMKTRTAWQTPIGAVAGALPVLIGTAAAEASLSRWAWTIFAIVYFWQFPHSMAIAWRYRDEFAAAGVRVAVAGGRNSRAASVLIIGGAAALLPIALAPVMSGAADTAYAAAATAFGLAYLSAALCFVRRPSDRSARWLLIISLLYLTGILAALLANHWLLASK